MTRKTGAERRTHARKAVRHPAKLRVHPDHRLVARLEEGGTWHHCLIINISPGGAKVSIGEPVGQAKTVHLEIAKFGRFGCEVVWRSGSELGLRFTHDPAAMSEVVMGLAVYG
ncbi:MAG: PilZ domain-containing protein [Elusimicrobia bacterium]|nr:PilZ domain-containing protein [Elusimicrobiota bacterium]